MKDKNFIFMKEARIYVDFNEIPDKRELISLTENEYVRLEFPTKILENGENKVLVNLIVKALMDYIDISNILVENVTDEVDWNDWELTYEHFPHNRYENKITGEIVETCSYKMSNFKEIDPEFFGIFIESSTQYPELIKIIKDTYHDTSRILDTVKTSCMDTDNLEKFLIKVEEKHKIEKELLELLLSYDKHDDMYKFIDVVILLNKEGISRNILVEILYIILSKLEDSQIVQDDIVGDMLDFITGWTTPGSDSPVYKLFIHFNPDRVE